MWSYLILFAFYLPLNSDYVNSCPNCTITVAFVGDQTIFSKKETEWNVFEPREYFDFFLFNNVRKIKCHAP